MFLKINKRLTIFQMDIKENALNRINEEENALSKTLASLQGAFRSENAKFHRLSKEARSLTSQIVNSARDVDKQMLSNDESISHSLSDRAKEESSNIEELIPSPYFARIVLEEDSENKKRIIEYKLGNKPHLDSGIIDWKNAPLAKLFYEYEEGETYLEDIRDRERSGKVLIKHKVKIKDSELKTLDCPEGRYTKLANGKWQEIKKGKISSEGKFELPSILSFITAEQFRLITEEASEPVILHGIAGSGKTSVALHRLTWQLAQEKAPNALVLTPNEILAKYLKNTLEKLEVKGAKVLTTDFWLNQISKDSEIESQYNKKIYDIPNHFARIKLSLSFTKTLLDLISNGYKLNTHEDAENLILTALRSHELFLSHDSSNLISKNDLLDAEKFTKNNFSNKVFDYSDEILLLYLYKTSFKKDSLPSYTHLFLDEFQEIPPAKLTLISSFIKNKNAITITGDIVQHTNDSYLHKASTEALLLSIDTNSTNDSLVHSLSVSHRSSLQIMQFADYLSGSNRTTDGRNGKAPLLILCDSFSSALRELKDWIKRVAKNFPGDPVLLAFSSKQVSREILSLIQSEFGSGISLLSESPRSTDGMILLASIEECKGLEFPHVMLWDITNLSYPKNEDNRRKLYLGATRAEEHLALISWGQPSPLLPPHNSKLLRIYDTRREQNNS